MGQLLLDEMLSADSYSQDATLEKQQLEKLRDVSKMGRAKNPCFIFAIIFSIEGKGMEQQTCV